MTLSSAAQEAIWMCEGILAVNDINNQDALSEKEVKSYNNFAVYITTDLQWNEHS